MGPRVTCYTATACLGNDWYQLIPGANMRVVVAHDVNQSQLLQDCLSLPQLTLPWPCYAVVCRCE